MLSHEPRCIFPRNLLSDVMCQLRFPEILTIGQMPPAAFQEAIRDEFPIYSSRKEAPLPKITGTPGNMHLEDQPAAINYSFASEDGVWRVNLTSKFISLDCSRYTRWETFAQKLDKPLAAFIKIYKPAFFERVGLRYLNFMSRRDLDLEGTPFRELIQPYWLGPLALENMPEISASRCSVDVEMALQGGCRAKIHAGPGLVRKNGQKDTEVKFIFDQDLFAMGKIPLNLSAGILETLHSQAWSLFRGAIRDELYYVLSEKS